MSNSNFAGDVQKYEMNQQNQQMNQQEGLLQAYEAKLKMGDAKAKALDSRIKMFVGDDPQATAIILEELQADPESIDPTNAFQTSTKIAGIVKRNGLQNIERDLALAGKQSDIVFKNAQARRMSADSINNTINYGPAGGGRNSPMPTQKGGMPPEQQAQILSNLYEESTQSAPEAEAKPIPLYIENKPFNEGLERGYQWAEMPDGSRVSMKIPTITPGGQKEVTPQTRILNTTKNLSEDYAMLKQMGAGISQDQLFLQNKINQLLLSEDVIGEFGGQTIMKGTPQQAVVERIKSNIPALLLDLKPASDAGAKQFDSDRDVKFMMQQASNPTNDFASNMVIINRIAKKYANQNLPNFFDSEQEAESANLPAGTIVFINNRQAIIE
jgi:hypothetical protein